jgi:hypothetical protein
MTRRIEAGPILLLLGALLLLVGLFLDWYDDAVNAWEAFEALDLLLAVVALALLAAAIGLISPDVAVVDRRWIPWLALLALAVVVSQLLDPPPAVEGDERELGAWLSLAGTVLLALGALLTFGRIHFRVDFEGRDPRRRVEVVDAPPATPATAATPPTEPTQPLGSKPEDKTTP